MTTRKPRSAATPPPFATQQAPADDFLATLFALGVTPEQIAAIQAEWGGDRPYIRKANETARAERSLRDRAIVRDHQRGESHDFIARRYGLCRSRVTQILLCAADRG
jgi:hypothetical protein